MNDNCFDSFFVCLSAKIDHLVQVPKWVEVMAAEEGFDGLIDS